MVNAMAIDSSLSSVGLVLSGGGAKGAFQVGVWKAMCEVGVADRVRVISGTSVGAINGAAFALLRDPERIRKLWCEHIQDVVCANFGLLDLTKIASVIWDAVRGVPFPFLGIFSRPGLVALLHDIVTQPISETGIDVYATASECRGSVLRAFDPAGYALRRFHLNEERLLEKIRLMILASASIPWGFDPVEIDGIRYVDGAFDGKGGDNVPVAPILENHPDIKTIYVVRCNSRQVEPETSAGCFGGDRKIVEIRPRRTLPGLLDDLNVTDDPTFKSWSGDFSFRSDYASRYIEAGYADGLASLRNPILDAKLEW